MSETTSQPAIVKSKKRLLFFDLVKRLVKEKPLGTFGAIVILIMLILAVFANFVAPYNPTQTHLTDRLSSPSGKYWLGTDQLGRDLLSRIIYGARVSLYIGLGASLLNVIVGTLLGLISGYLGGAFDLFFQRFVDFFLSIPTLVVLISLVSIVGNGVVQLILIMGVDGGIGWSRVVRSAVLSLRENTYVEAGRVIGGNSWHMMRRHIFPNILPVMVIIFSVSIAGNILAESGLSFLGLGVPPPTPTWGGMLSAEGRSYMYRAPWLAFFPGLILTIVIYGVNMWGDAMRDLLDPRLRGGAGRFGNVAKKARLKLKIIKDSEEVPH